ncbi:MAG: DUF2842 domain-containing protein [Xanthobacteraceae bacterium]
MFLSRARGPYSAAPCSRNTALFQVMPVRLRKLFGAVALFVLVIVWALLAMAVAQFPAIRDNTVLSILYYVVAGLGWILPAMPLVSWMSAPRSGSEIRKP